MFSIVFNHQSLVLRKEAYAIKTRFFRRKITHTQLNIKTLSAKQAKNTYKWVCRLASRTNRLHNLSMRLRTAEKPQSPHRSYRIITLFFRKNESNSVKQLRSGRFFRQIIATNRNKSVIFARYYTHLARSTALSITAGFASLT